MSVTWKGALTFPVLYKRTYAGLPTVLQQAKLIVMEVPKADWDHAGFTGWYSYDGVIELRKPPDKSARSRDYWLDLLVHEVAHGHYYQVLTDAQRAAWVAFWNHHTGQMPDSYARSSAREGYAESCEYLIRQPHQLNAAVAQECRRLLGL